MIGSDAPSSIERLIETSGAGSALATAAIMHHTVRRKTEASIYACFIGVT
jgi:hypothetical protein